MVVGTVIAAVIPQVIAVGGLTRIRRSVPFNFSGAHTDRKAGVGGDGGDG